MSLLILRRPRLAPPGTVTPSGGDWLANLAQTNLAKPTGKTVIPVTNWPDYKTRCTNLSDDEEIELQNDITATDNFSMSNAGGSAGAEAVINHNGYKVVDGFANGGSGHHSFGHSNVNHVIYWDCHWDGGGDQTWGPSFGTRYSGDPQSACSYITLAGCVIEGTYQQGLKVGTGTHHMTIDGLEVKHWSCVIWDDFASSSTVEGQGATACYFGEGSANGSVSDVDIRSLWVHDPGYVGSPHTHVGMGLQIKHNGSRYTIREFLFEGLNTRSQGALNINYDTTSVATNHLFEDFIIRNVFRAGVVGNPSNSGYGGQAITPGSQVTMRRGLLYNLDTHGIQPVRNGTSSPNLDADIENMTIWNTGNNPGPNSAPYGIAQTPGQYQSTGTSYPVYVGDMATNISPGGPSGIHVPTAADFVDINAADALAGFQLAASSSIPATAGALGKESAVASV